MQLPTRVVRPASLGFEFEVLAGDTIIGPAIERGSWADHETALFRAHVSSGARVVDLGANVGWFAVQAVLAGAEVHAFEPVPAIAEVARRNIERAMAHASGRGVVHVLAAGAARGSAAIQIGAGNFGDNRVVEAGAGRPRDMGQGQSVEIAIAPVDELVQGPVRFLKVDTQGSEWLALEGARKLLAASPDLGLLIEFWPYALRGATPQELVARLFELGFTLGKATEAPYPMSAARILRQALARDPVRGGLDLYGARGAAPFHVLGLRARLHGCARSLKED
jgi:FkbM family methyltransferase